MKRCHDCSVEIAGDWTRCPLCGEPTKGHATPSPFPTVALNFSRRHIFRLLFIGSLVIIVGSFAVQLFLGHGPAEFGALRSVWLGVVTMWLVAVVAVRKRRNVAKSIVYLVLLVGLLSLYWDYLTGWQGWSLNYAIPIVCGSSILALLITVWSMRMEVGNYIIYSGMTILLGLLPIAFLVFGWVTTTLPSAICVAVGVIGLVVIQVYRGAEVRHELAKRLHL
ncbi:MAG TPA: DUF6320 domain-containing protein [Enteractinococcus sp.]